MTTKPTPDPEEHPGGSMPFLYHLVELRDRLLRIVLTIFVVFLVMFPFANDLYQAVASPLLRHLPDGSTMIATEVASPFLTPFKLTLVLAIFLSMPMILYQLWAFVAPGLYKHEKRFILPLVVASTGLFYLGMAFAYYVVFPLVFAFFIGTTPDGVAVMTDIARYLDFVLKLFFAFGLAFEVPIATIIVVRTGISTPESLREKRPYIIVGAFIFGMLLTPPDVISQSLLAVPMWLLFELGIFFSSSFVKTGEEGTGDEGGSGEEAPQPVSEPEPEPKKSAVGGAYPFTTNMEEEIRRIESEKRDPAGEDD